MNRFQQGMFFGLILSTLITLALALKLNDQRRLQLSNRLEKLRTAFPGIEHLTQFAQETATRARETGNQLGEQVQGYTGKQVQRAREVVSPTQQRAASLSDNEEIKHTV